MLTSQLTSFTARFNPFSKLGKTARLALAQLPPSARQTLKVTTEILPRTPAAGVPQGEIIAVFKDGKKIQLKTENMTLKEVEEELDRHSRILSRKEELAG